MFGKGGGPLNAWIKEFYELVFIQTLQAFVFALTIGFIISILGQQTAMDKTDQNTSLGIICIVALTSIFKIEEIARRIFGYGPTKADHGNAVASIGKSMSALKMGKNLLDNGKKVVSGAGAVFGANKERVKAIKRAQRKVGALEADNAGGKESGAGGDSVGQRKIDSDKRDKKIQLFNEAQKARRLASQEKDEKKKKALIAEAKKKLQQSRAIDDTLVDSNPANGAGGTSSGGGRIKDYNQKKMQIDDELQDKLKEIKNKRSQGFKTMVSGVAETGAAMVGFTAGTAMSVASTNDWGGAVKDGISWAGTADAVAAGTVDFGYGLKKFVDNRREGARDMAAEYAGNVKAAYKDYVNEMEKADKEISNETQRAMENTKSAAEAAAKDAANRATKQSSSKSPSKAKIGVKALGKGFADTYHNHSTKFQKKVLNDAYDRLEKMSTSKKSVDTEGNILH